MWRLSGLAKVPRQSSLNALQFTAHTCHVTRYRSNYAASSASPSRAPKSTSNLFQELNDTTQTNDNKTNKYTKYRSSLPLSVASAAPGESSKLNQQRNSKSKKSLAEKLFADDSPSGGGASTKSGKGKPLIDQEAFNRMRSEFAELRKLREQQQKGEKERKAYGKTNWGSLANEKRKKEPTIPKHKRIAEEKAERRRNIMSARNKAKDRVFEKVDKHREYEQLTNARPDRAFVRKRSGRSRTITHARQLWSGQRRKQREVKRPDAADIPVTIKDAEISVADLAHAMRRRVRTVQRKLFDIGEEHNRDTMLDPDTAELIAEDFGHPVRRTDFQDISPLAVAEKRKKIEQNENTPTKPPVVTVLGHVDHGKTTLLDVLRSTNSASNEAGGITQAVSSFMVNVDQDIIPGEKLYAKSNQKEDKSKKNKTKQKKKKSSKTAESANLLTFIDTPGHSLFSKMRSSGASATDFVTLVVAAEDGVMPQTEEAVRLCLNRENPIPMVVAVTKIDRYPNIDEAVERISSQLMNLGLQTDRHGGSTPIVPISAMSGEGIQELKEIILLQAEDLDLKADPEDRAEAHVLESRVVKGLGPVVDCVVQWGTLRPRDHVVVSDQYCRIKTLLDSSGNPIKEAKPGTPVRIGTFDDTVSADDVVLGVDSEETGRKITEKRSRKREISRLLEEGKKLDEKKQIEMQQQKQKKKKEQDIAVLQQRTRRRKAIEHKGLVVPEDLKPQQWEIDLENELLQLAYESGGSFDDAIGRIGGSPTDNIPKVPVIIRADTHGSLESLCDAIDQLPQDEIDLQVVRKDVGAVSDADIDYAKDAGALIFTFNVRVPPSLEKKADKEGVSLHSHDVIYKFVEDLASTMSEYLPFEEEKEVIGKAEVSQVFKLNTTGARSIPETVAGCRVQSGVLEKNATYQLERDGEIIHEFESAHSLKRFKEPVERIEKGQECGVALGEKFTDFRSGDILIALTKKKVKRTISTPFS